MMGFSLFTNMQFFTSQDINWWIGVVDYCNVLISCLDSHSDGTYSRQRIHWQASDVMLLQTIDVNNNLI